MVEVRPSTSEAAYMKAAFTEEQALEVLQTNVRKRISIHKNISSTPTVVPNGQIVIEFGNEGEYLDLTDAKLRLNNLQCSATVGAVRFQNGGPFLLLNQIVVYAGGTRVASMQHVGLWCLLNHYLRGNPSSVNQDVLGFADRATRDTWGATNRSYEIPISYLLPGITLWDQRYGALRLEINMANATFPLESTAGGVTGETWSFNGSTSFIQYSAVYMKDIHPVRPHVWRSYKVIQQQATAGTASFGYSLDHHTHNTVGILAVEQLQAATLLTNLDRAESWVLNGRTEHQAKLDGVFYPNRPTTYTAVDYYEAYTEMLRNVPVGFFPSGADPDTGAMDSMSLITPGAWANALPVPGKNVVAFNLARSDSQGARGILAGVNSTKANSETRVEFRAAAGLTANSVYTIFIVYQSVLRPVGGGFVLEE